MLLGANVEVLDRVADSLSADAGRLQDIRTLAQRAVHELRSGWDGADLVDLTNQWERMASPLLTAASASLDTYAARLRTQSAAQRATSGMDGGGQGPFPFGMLPLVAAGPFAPGTGAATSTGTPADTPAATSTETLSAVLSGIPSPPPPGASPGDNASWWTSLSEQQQGHVIGHHPEWIGNHDGVAFAARDLANRAMIEGARARLEDQQNHLERELADNRFGGAFTHDDAALDHVTEKLAALAEIDATLAKAGERQLILLDLSAERAQAAVARGNVDTARDVAVFVPGLSATVTGALKTYDSSMGQLQRRAELEGSRVNHTGPTGAAVVTWIGYQAPQMGRELLSANSVISDHAAERGAELLVPFLQGIDAARDHDVHLTLLGHSYGSTLAGLALQQHTGVDDAVFFGSPGLGTDHLPDLLLDSGHAYYIEARQDLVGDLGRFGADPSHLAGVEQASARDSVVVDPVTGERRHFREVVGHSSYLDDDSTSQYNLSVVAGGVPDRRVHDDGAVVGNRR